VYGHAMATVLNHAAEGDELTRHRYHRRRVV
jgi:hypothetical protein